MSSSPKYIDLKLSVDALQEGDAVWLIVSVQWKGKTYRVQRGMSDEAIKRDGVEVVATQLEGMAAELRAKAAQA